MGHGTWDSRDGFMTINMILDSFMSFEKLWVVGGALGFSLYVSVMTRPGPGPKIL